MDGRHVFDRSLPVAIASTTENHPAGKVHGEDSRIHTSAGTIQRVTENGASMKCDGSHGWDEGLSLWIDKDTGFDFYWDIDRPW